MGPSSNLSSLASDGESSRCQPSDGRKGECVSRGVPRALCRCIRVLLQRLLQPGSGGSGEEQERAERRCTVGRRVCTDLPAASHGSARAGALRNTVPRILQCSTRECCPNPQSSGLALPKSARSPVSGSDPAQTLALMFAGSSTSRRSSTAVKSSVPMNGGRYLRYSICKSEVMPSLACV